MVTPGDFIKILAPFVPLAQFVILYITPIYIAIGEFFSIIALGFLSILPEDSLVLAYILMGVFIALGIVFGIISERKATENNP